MNETAEQPTWRGVHAVVYTYNRKELAAQCIKALQCQTVAPERIVLVDNGSTDGTEDYLRRRGLLDDPRIDFVRNERNSGAAGGLKTGISYAFHQGCAWAWVMDDDVIVAPDALERLKEAYQENFGDPSQVGFLVSQLVGPDGRANNVPQIDERQEAPDRCAEWGMLLDRGIVRVRIATLTSILLPRATLEKCGTPSSDFFIWGEDTDYTLRITSWRPGYLVGRSRGVHLRGVGGFLDIFNENDPQRIRRFSYLYRNTLYLRRAHWPRHAYFLFLGKAGLHLFQAFGGRRYRWRRAWAILSGIAAGFFFKPRHDLLVSDDREPPQGRIEARPATHLRTAAHS
jgi:GT2 family glycosyltransferase